MKALLNLSDAIRNGDDERGAERERSNFSDAIRNGDAPGASPKAASPISVTLSGMVMDDGREGALGKTQQSE